MIKLFINSIRNKERKQIIERLEDSLYPLEYGRWQADELMDEVFRIIKEGQ